MASGDHAARRCGAGWRGARTVTRCSGWNPTNVLVNVVVILQDSNQKFSFVTPPELGVVTLKLMTGTARSLF